ncbi:LPP20 family lipoprotein [Sulfurimonas sp. SAG-AH-194-C20]|nr:LPP20 family lipoprotein [Sulfurimonas sp. SAG-AH-194-C20]MDF1878839.1 LPP20 family lipoprotein [Sulfurimonas sp. SAG-AH-194-C20]
MKYSLLVVALLSAVSLEAVDTATTSTSTVKTESVPQKVQTVNVPTTSTINVNYPVYSQSNTTQATQEKQNVASLTAEVNDVQSQEDVLAAEEKMLISVVGQGVAPMNTSSPAQAYALAKRAAVADAYRLIAEKVKGVRIDGQDLIKNMMVKRSTVRTSVAAMVRNANIVETTFKEGLCEVEMEIVISHTQFK